MCVLRKKIKNYEEGKYKLETKVKAVAGVRDIGIGLKYGDLLESYIVITVQQKI